MEPVEKIIPEMRSRSRQTIKTHHLSSFGILNRNGLEITNGRDLPDIEQLNESKRAEFSDWSMPEQRQGYIQCKKHDFF
ncbi:MAG: hypothetical protein ACXWV6_02795 [Chitinophagaceae bacterium]